MQALILAAGLGKRMRGLCAAVPKPMIPLANRPCLRLILDGLAEAGITRAVVVVGHHAEQVRDHFRRRPHPLAPRFVEQAVPDGTGRATLLGREHLSHEPFLLAFGDIIVSRGGYRAFLEAYRPDPCPAWITVHEVPDPCHGAAVYLGTGGRVTRIVEKPRPGTSRTNLDNAGIFIFPPEIFDILSGLRPSERGEYELTDAIAALVAQGRVAAHRLKGFWFNLTDPEALIAANAAVLAERMGRHVPDISGCALRPPVCLGDGCRLERAALGPNVSLGGGCVVEDSARIAHAVLMEECRVGPRARVEYAVLPPGACVPVGTHLTGAPERVLVPEAK